MREPRRDVGRSIELRLSAPLALCAIVAIAMSPSRALAAEEHEEKEPLGRTLIVGVGIGAEYDVRDRTARSGPTISTEWEAVDDWLEFELGASLLTGGDGADVPVELLAKKPFRLARGVEMMIGVGPELVYASATRKAYLGASGAVDFMFWPSQHFGFWVEPSCDVVAENGASVGIGGTLGVLSGW